MESLKVTTKKASLRLIEYAFEFTRLSGRKKITVVHKANIMYLVIDVGSLSTGSSWTLLAKSQRGSRSSNTTK